MQTTTSTGLGTAQVPVATLSSAARALAHAGRWDQAAGLLDQAVPGTSAAQAELARLAAEIAIERDYVTGTREAPARLAAAERLRGPAPGLADGTGWDLAFLGLRQQYAEQVTGPGGAAQLGPRGRDAAEIGRLRDRARQLREAAPDGLRRGWAELCLGWIADNLYGERDLAPGHYEAALAAGQAGRDDLLVREALRHLGDHDHDRGDHAAALDRWQGATAAGARAGAVAGTLAQQLLLAVLARDAGDEAGARLLAGEVARWAAAAGAVRIAAQAAAFLAGVDPTVPPPG
jgi:hypothetical protein